jgi:DNA-binding CsgD family transcriptional regulator
LVCFLFLFLYLYNMLRFLIYLLFILSVAFASTGVVLSSRLRNKYKSGFFSTLMYFQVFIFTFGFYGIWGQIVIKAFLSDYVTPELITRFTDISLLMGLPFLVFAWLMLIKFSLEISGRKSSNWFIFSFLLINFLIILGVGYFISRNTGIKPPTLVRIYFIILNFIYTIIASIIILFTGKSRSILFKYENQITAFSITILMVLQSIALYFYQNKPIVGMIFILLFFAGNSFLPVYLSYGNLITEFSEKPVNDISYDDFFKRYEISPRESDIIHEICNGLSNKEISEKLFISLQTVKDHTHRIYIKTNVRSRAQLMNMVKVVREINS